MGRYVRAVTHQCQETGDVNKVERPFHKQKETERERERQREREREKKKECMTGRTRQRAVCKHSRTLSNMYARSVFANNCLYVYAVPSVSLVCSPTQQRKKTSRHLVRQHGLIGAPRQLPEQWFVSPPLSCVGNGVRLVTHRSSRRLTSTSRSLPYP